MRLVIIDDKEVKLVSFIFDTLNTNVEEEANIIIWKKEKSLQHSALLMRKGNIPETILFKDQLLTQGS